MMATKVIANPMTVMKRRGATEKERNTVDAETEHLCKRIFALACLTSLTVIIDKSLTEAQLANDGSKEEVALWILHQRLQRAIGHHTEVGMIIHHLLIHALHQLIESLGGETLEEEYPSCAPSARHR